MGQGGVGCWCWVSGGVVMILLLVGVGGTSTVCGPALRRVRNCEGCRCSCAMSEGASSTAIVNQLCQHGGLWCCWLVTAAEEEPSCWSRRASFVVLFACLAWPVQESLLLLLLAMVWSPTPPPFHCPKSSKPGLPLFLASPSCCSHDNKHRSGMGSTRKLHGSCTPAPDKAAATDAGIPSAFKGVEA